MFEQIDYARRRFFGTAAMYVAASQLSMSGSANAQPGNAKPKQLPAIKSGTNTSLGALKQINAGPLSVGYAEVGPADGAPVVLLHGWPYDIHSFVDVTPLLAAAGYRVIVPYLRGYGATRFLSNDTVRNAQPVCCCIEHDRIYGRAQDRQGNSCRLRLGSADRQHRLRTLLRSCDEVWTRTAHDAVTAMTECPILGWR
jgi:pimeloyl-ACP methyl ester carboxylesterase